MKAILDPRRGLTDAKIKAMCAAYMTPGRSVKEVAKTFGVCADRLREVVRSQGCKLRGRDFAIRQSRGRLGKRTLGYVFGGMAKDATLVEPFSLEQAKIALRKKGRVVFNAEVDGSGPKGMIKCDGQLFTAEQIIERAGQ